MHEEKAARPNVLVLGGAGFVGSNLCEFLLQKYNVICVDNYSGSTESEIDHLLSHPHFEFIRHDVTAPLDFSSVKDLERFRVPFIGVQYVIHAASLSAPGAYLSHPVETMMANASGVKNALDFALTYRARFVYISDPSVYGAPEYLEPQSVCAVSKRFGEHLVATYTRLYSLETSTVRLYSTFGPNTTLTDTRVIPSLIRLALANEPIPFPKPLMAKESSFLYVSDAVDALEKIMTAEHPGTYDLGSPTGMPMSAVVKKIIEKTHSSSVVIDGPPSPESEILAAAWELECAVPSIQHIRQETGWFPVVLFEDGLEKTIDFLKSLRGVRHA